MFRKIYNFLMGRNNDTIVVFHGKVRIPHIGHKHVIDKCKEISSKLKCDMYINMTSVEPFQFDKIRKQFAEELFETEVHISDENTSSFFDFITFIQDKGYKNIVVVAGPDRAIDYQNIFDKYNNEISSNNTILLRFDSWKVESVGTRINTKKNYSLDEIRTMLYMELVEIMSATLIEKCIKNRDYRKFYAYYRGVPYERLKKMYWELCDYYNQK